MEPEKWTPLDEFAKVAMQATLENLDKFPVRMGREHPFEEVAEESYSYTAAMMAEKARQEAKT